MLHENCGLIGGQSGFADSNIINIDIVRTISDIPEESHLEIGGQVLVWNGVSEIQERATDIISKGFYITTPTATIIKGEIETLRGCYSSGFSLLPGNIY